MLTSLRIDDDLYREAKVGAAKAGLTITKFLNEAIKLRLVWEVGTAAQAVSRPKTKIVLPVCPFPTKPGGFSLEDYHHAEEAYWADEAQRLGADK